MVEWAANAMPSTFYIVCNNGLILHSTTRWNTMHLRQRIETYSHVFITNDNISYPIQIVTHYYNQNRNYHKLHLFTSELKSVKSICFSNSSLYLST